MMPRRNQPAQQSQADALWAQADQWLTEASDPTSSTAEREFARNQYADAVQAAQQAENAEAAR